MKKLLLLFGTGILTGGVVLALWVWSMGPRPIDTIQSSDQSTPERSLEEVNNEARAYLEQNKKTAEIISRAAENNDTALCASVPVDVQDSCRTEIAIRARDVSRCPPATSPMKDLCEGVILTSQARETRDITQCAVISDQSQQENCYRWFTQGECATIKDIQKQGLCIALFENQEEG